jgi:phage terminase small subunit
MKCKWCNKQIKGRSNQRYCSGGKCKKAFENSLRGKPKDKKESKKKNEKPHSNQTPLDSKQPDLSGTNPPAPDIKRPEYLVNGAADYWDKVAPILIKRGHLNPISEDMFIELCDLVQRLRDINNDINKAGRQLIDGEEENALSDVKRKYSKLLLDYSRQFYLTPLSNRGNFGIEDEKPEDDKKAGKERFF